MARVLALVPDLLFGSRLEAALAAGGHEVERVGTAADARARASGAEVLVVDLTSDAPAGTALAREIAAGGDPRPRTLGFYSHVEVEVRDRARAAGFDLVVPRSRMHREAADLVTRLAAAD